MVTQPFCASQIGLLTIIDIPCKNLLRRALLLAAVDIRIFTTTLHSN